MLRISAKELNGIMMRAVERGLNSREEFPLHKLGLDEKSMKNGHHYMTVLSDLERKQVYDIAEGRGSETTVNLISKLSESQRNSVN